MICLISFSKFSDVLSAFTHARTSGNFSNIFLGVNILHPSPFVAFTKNISLLKAIRVNSRPLQRAFTPSILFPFFPYLL